VLVTEDGERTMATHLGIASLLDILHIDEALVSRAQVLYLEGYLWDLPQAREAMMHSIEIAHEADALVALTVSDSFCVERHRSEFLDLLQDHVDLLFANESEVVSLCKDTIDQEVTFDSAVEFVADLGVLAALTRGGAGSVVVTPTGAVHVAPEPVEQVVDTSGAGDLYAAGFLYGLTHGFGPEESGRLGSICAAEVISHIGSRPIADLAELAGLV
jgi:sugar/nucleoside kinase (ribokinase family)